MNLGQFIVHDVVVLYRNRSLLLKEVRKSAMVTRLDRITLIPQEFAGAQRPAEEASTGTSSLTSLIVLVSSGMIAKLHVIT